MEIVVVVATIMGGIAAGWYFWDKLQLFFFKGQVEEQKPPNLSAESVHQLIGDSAPFDWSYYDPERKYYYKKDVQLTIDRHPVQRDSQFPEAWVHKFPDKSAHAVKFNDLLRCDAN